MQELIVVDKNDNLIKYTQKSVRKKGDIIRVSAAWIENEKGEILLAQRVFTKKHDPGKWGPAVAGTVEKGETYLSNIIKEVEEEIGVVVEEHQCIPIEKYFMENSHPFFVQLYLINIESSTSLHPQPDEVVKTKWVSWEEYENDILDHPENYVSQLVETSNKIKQWKLKK